MCKAVALLFFAGILGIAIPAGAGVADIRGGGEIVRTWSVGFWEFDIGSFDSVRLDWVSGQVLSPPFVMNLDVDGSYGSPFGHDGWEVIAGDAHEAVVWCGNPTDWLGFDVEFLSPVGPTSWLICAYEGERLKDLERVTYDGSVWTFERIGACCIPDGSCTLMSAAACADTQGAWLGSAAECTHAGCQQTPIGALSWGKVKSLYR